ncbi:MAG TPA: O-antigen ligase family protein [Nitrospira sp.]|nr:O-antigen ligase family protein [Nitrospira sp.]
MVSVRTIFSLPLCFISALLIFAPLQEGGNTHLAVAIIRLLVLALLLVFVFSGIKTGRLVIPTLPIEFTLLLFICLATLATLASPYSHPSLQWLLILVSYITFLYLLVSFVTAWHHIKTLVTVAVLIAVGESVWTIVQWFVWNTFRPSGTFFNPNFLAGYLVGAWAIVLGTLVYQPRRGATSLSFSWKQTFECSLHVGVLASILSAMVLTGSRGGLVVFLFATLFIATMRWGWKAAAGAGVVILIAVLSIPNPLRDRVLVEHNDNPVSYARWQMWRASVRQMVDRPFGIGLGLYQYMYPRYAFPVEGEIARYGKTAQTAHSEYLQMGVEMGPTSIVVFAVTAFFTGRDVTRLLNRRLTRWQRGVAVGLSAACLAILIHAALDSNLREPAIAILLLLCTGLLLSASRLSTGAASPVREILVRSRALWGTVVVIVVTLYVAETLRWGVAWKLFETASERAAVGETTAAIDGYRRAAEWDPGKALYHHAVATMYARIFEKTGDEDAFDAARTEYEEASRLNPLDGRIPALLGQLYAFAVKAPSRSLSKEQRVARMRSALEAYDRAIRLMPYSALYRYERARVQWLLGERDEAERRAREVETMEPNFLPARALLARLALESDQFDEVKDQLHEIQARQAQYLHWQKNTLEQLYLDVDVEPILVALKKKEAAG